MADDGRAEVLAAVRRALGRGAAEGEAEPDAVRRRLQQPASNTVPARAALQQPELTELFVAQALQAGATLARLSDRGGIPAAVAAFRDEHDLPPTVVCAPASPLLELPWSSVGLKLESRLVGSGDPLAVSTAAAGIAETGTLVLLSGPENPVTANFLPDHHLVVIDRRDLLGTAEQLWAMLRERGEALPRTVNWITGPSRSGDIEMTMLMGAHGPLRLHLLLLDQGA